MGYLSVSNFWKYQNADVWKKCKGHPPWCKLWVHRDRELDALPPMARLLWYEILGAATRHANVLGGPAAPVDNSGLSESEAKLKQKRSDFEANLKWLWAETRVEPEVIAEVLPLLLKGGWLRETQTPRRSRLPSRKSREETLPLVREEVEEEKPPKPPTPKSGEDDVTAKRISRAIENGVLTDAVDLEAELAAHPTLTDEQRAFLRGLVAA